MKINKAKEIQAVKDEIDNYNNTVFAIIGFLNTYKYELKKEYSDIHVFQGRKLFLNHNNDTYVTPDLGLTLGSEQGVIGEVKYSFPSEKQRWTDDFTQLKKYDTITHGWTTGSGTVTRFDIVLLVQQSRSRLVTDFYVEDISTENKLINPFAIIEFNRSSQGKEYIQFRIEHGKLSHPHVHQRFYQGLPVAMDIFIKLYAKIKIYDVEPPLPLMLNYIYDYIIDKQLMAGKYKRITKKSKQLVFISVRETTSWLNAIYSFKSLQSKKYNTHQPEYPRQEWVRKALDHLSHIGEGTWVNKHDGEFNYLLTHKDNSVLDHYIKTVIDHPVLQQSLFD